MTKASLLKTPQATDIEAANRHYALSVETDPGAIIPQWRELESKGELTAFQTQAWLMPWYCTIAPALGISPIFVTVRDRSSGQPMMMLPLCLRRERGITTIEFPDCGVSDYNAPLLAPEFRPNEKEFEALWNYIVSALPSADLIRFDKMPKTVADRPNPMARLAGSKRMHLRAWGVDLPKTRAEYDKILKTVARKELRRKRRNLENLAPMRYVRAQSEAQGREFFEVHRRQRLLRSTELDRDDILNDPVFSRFYEAVIFDRWTKEFGTLSALMVGEEIAATLFALNFRGHYLLLMHCFETRRWGFNSPGIVAIDSAITDQIESGTKYFDLTIGNETYKRQFGVQENFLYYREQGLSPVGWAAIAMREARRFAASQVRKLPEKYWPKRMRR